MKGIIIAGVVILGIISLAKAYTVITSTTITMGCLPGLPDNYTVKKST